MAGQHDGHLGAVYEAKAPEEVAALYDGWAATYDTEMAKAGYRHPAIGLALLARHLPRGAGPVLDAGCGTGLLGDWLGIMGFGPVEGLDLSEGMLAVARAKGVYARLHQLALGQTLPFADGAFAGVISTGVFTTGHVGIKGVPELVRITAAGGPIVLTVKTTLWEAGFGAALEGMAGVAVVERTEPYVSMPGEAGTVPSLAVVLRRG
ncbi:class I SAM-dependent DNA methyltransferase [Fuscovulum ytuae]|uniref:Class I SAM-dependent methyltransferase n=1 Tax=Fuscovulum ytuae TaxID=3042299 RepID=A0ABY8Q6W6_9RHOB|nr:class I SAM-dependent methyltransferase [Fuscovulum sp. YMD61]WGV15947.1 class I SAM-dependent methyltransferase [Fuscovulum sp. YMD61]